jgi:2-C-methyl-D-erythritol 2,4-cyclodiphosphate synthase
VDTTLVAERPRLAEHRERIREGLAGMLRLEAGRVNVKLKSADGLGAIGRGEGIAAQAVVLLEEETG